MLVQEAAHEDANIIFGAVIDESVPEGEMRVTVIATGLDDGREQRPAPDRPRGTAHPPQLEQQQLEIENVTSIHREPAPLEPVTSMQQVAMPPAQETARERTQPTPRQHESPSQAPIAPPQPSAQGTAEGLAQSGLDFASPFDDEYDTPAFIRRRNSESDDEDREIPAFLRRAQD